jgi:hypothetical protein
MSETSTPLLYYAPESSGQQQPMLPPDKKTTISGVQLEQGTYPEQIRTSTSIEPGDSVVDTYLFEVPDEEKASLILSLPPSMHRGTMPVLFRIDYEQSAPDEETRYGVGEAVALDGVTFEVTSMQTTWVETTHKSDGKGYSARPLFKVSYRISNDTEAPVTYAPGHDALAGKRVAQLHSGEGSSTFARMTFGSSIDVVGRLSGDTRIEPGSSVEDFSIFERPGDEVESVVFVFPATRVERRGLIRVESEYQREAPEKPKPLREGESEEAE